MHLWVSLWYDCEKEGKAADVGGALSLILNRVKVQEFPRKTIFWILKIYRVYTLDRKRKTFINDTCLHIKLQFIPNSAVLILI